MTPPAPSPASSARLVPLEEHPRALAWSPDARTLAVALAHGRIALLDVPSSSLLTSWDAHRHGLQQLAWQPTQPLLASAGEDGRVRLWSLPQTSLVHDLDGAAPWVEHLAWSPSGDCLAAAAGRTLQLWSVDARPLRSWPDHPSTITGLQWRPDGRALATASYRVLRIFRPEEPAHHQHLDMPTAFLGLAWSPDGRHLAAGTQECSVIYQRLPCHRHPPLQMTGFPNKIRHLAWDPSSAFLTTVGGPTPCVWDVSGKGPAGRTPRQLHGHESRVTALAAQSKGPTLASGDAAGTVWLWHPSRTQQGLVAAQLPDAITALAWAPDESCLAIASADGSLHLLR